MIEIRCPPAKFHLPPELFVFARKKGIVLDYSCWTSDLGILDVKSDSEVLCGEVGFPRLPKSVREACPTIRICYHSEKAALLGVRPARHKPNTMLQ